MVGPPLRVLHVLEATLGGTRRYLEDIAVTTAGAPMVQGLVYGTSRSDPGFCDLLDLTRRAGWYLVAADAMRRSVDPFADARSIAIVRGAIRNFKPAVLHAHSAKGGAIGRVAALTYGPRSPRVVYSPHALPARLGAVYMAVERGLAPFTKRFIAVSDSERQEIIDEGIVPGDRVDVVYPRIDAAHFAPRDQRSARVDLRLPADVPIVLGIGRLAPQKDPLSFVATLARLRAVAPDTVGLWVGDGQMRPQVEASAADLQLGDAFRIAGWITDVRPYIAAADILLSTSRYESFGYVIPETFAMERPVVASRVVGTVDVFFAAAQPLLFTANRLEEAVLSLKRLIDDSAFRREIGRLGRESVIKKFSNDAMRTALYTSYDMSVS